MKLIWTPAAVEDLQDIVDYIAARSPDSAARVTSHIFKRIEALPLTPNIGHTGRQHGTLELVMRPWRYIVVYRLSSEAVRILRIRHGSQA